VAAYLSSRIYKQYFQVGESAASPRKKCIRFNLVNPQRGSVGKNFVTRPAASRVNAVNNVPALTVNNRAPVAVAVAVAVVVARLLR
jgi:hypothetical protein